MNQGFYTLPVVPVNALSMNNTYYFTSRLWQYDGFGGWHFVNVPVKMSQEIKERFAPVKKRGWGSIYVTATIGNTSWNTSIFPFKDGFYLLAIKSQVRAKENILIDSNIPLKLTIRDI